MAPQGMQIKPWGFALVFATAILYMTDSVHAKWSLDNMNVIDRCWRWDYHWSSHREQLANCSVGFAGTMTNNIGPDLIHYEVTDPSDDPVNPKPGTLRYGATLIRQKVWITFAESMKIKLQMPLIISSYTAIDGRGVNVRITGGACLVIDKATNVIIHGLRIYGCEALGGGNVINPEGKIVHHGQVDGDAIRITTSSKIWIDHNTMYDCQDGLVDVTLNSTEVTISNNWFRYQNKVMLLGHDDSFVFDKDMKVTVVLNYFGPRCGQRMPRVRHGYAHVVNNLYLGWGLYAIGGSVGLSVKSQANLFIAPKQGQKRVTWIKNNGTGMSWNFGSIDDVFMNGASLHHASDHHIKPNYTNEQWFPVADASTLELLTSHSGVLRCPRKSRC